jgi:hypothetical protein
MQAEAVTQCLNLLKLKEKVLVVVVVTFRWAWVRIRSWTARGGCTF